MTAVSDRDERLAARLERIAAELREGDATLYGYDVRTDPRPRERGGVSYSDGWLSFEHSRRDDADRPTE
jgi:hypothetical protein